MRPRTNIPFWAALVGSYCTDTEQLCRKPFGLNSVIVGCYLLTCSEGVLSLPKSKSGLIVQLIVDPQRITIRSDFLSCPSKDPPPPFFSLPTCKGLERNIIQCRSLGWFFALQVITATPRQLESGVRLAESLARMRLSATVEPSDVAEGLRLMQALSPPPPPPPHPPRLELGLHFP